MELRRVTVIESPVHVGRVRLCGEVVYDRADVGAEQYWFEVPEAQAAELSTAGDPWLAWLLPLAVTLHEPLRICRPVDRGLYQNVHELMAIWRAWYPHLSVVPIEADSAAGVPTGAPARTAAFFSGGVDSFFTVLRPHDAVDDLVTVWGFDVPLERADAVARLCRRFRAVAAELEKGFVDVATNIRTTHWRMTDWGPLSHGCALAGTALGLGRRYGQVRIAATGGYRDLHPWGSHPLTDPLLSTGQTAVVHDGAAFTRVQKLELLVTSPVALGALHVCWRSQSDHNCGACNKCYRTMLILELLGARERCSTFSPAPLDLGAAAKVYCAHPWDFREFQDIKALALTRGRGDVAHAADLAMRRSRRLSQGLKVARAFRDRRWLGRWSERLERRLLAGWIL